MNAAVAIDSIWKAIRESERSDEIQFMDDKIPIKAEAARLTQQQPNQSGAVNCEPIMRAASRQSE